MKPQLFTLLLISVGCCLDVFGQTTSNLDQLQAKERLNAQLREEDEQRKKAVEMGLQRGKESEKVATTANLYFSSENELPSSEKKLLAADGAELQKYDPFLRQPQTGLFKLLNYQETKAALTDAKSQFAYPRIRGGGAYYSFAKRNHNADEWAQIHLRDGVLQAAYTEMKRTTVASSGGVSQSFVYISGYSLAVFTTLGNVALEEVTLQQPALQALAGMQPPTRYQDFVEQIKQYSVGVNIGQNRYQSALPARPDTTYAMRSLNYKKADVIVAFRIVHQDRDGSLHILWKQLKSHSPAELKGKSAKP